MGGGRERWLPVVAAWSGRGGFSNEGVECGEVRGAVSAEGGPRGVHHWECVARFEARSGVGYSLQGSGPEQPEPVRKAVASTVTAVCAVHCLKHAGL